jgi:hypothetical protein
MSIVRWTGRVFALGLFLFWGASLVEHLQQGFLQSVKELPPVWVWLGYLAHRTFLVGLVALWRWPLTGSMRDSCLLAVLDPFAGSNTAGEACQELSRRWLAIQEVACHPAQRGVPGSRPVPVRAERNSG